jgi:NADH-quinone oxidoreductase subunit N
MLAGVVVTTQLGIAATAFYLAVYLMMNLAAFSVIAVRERETRLGDDISAMNGLGADRPVLAWTMTIAMLALAGIPATAGFFGKIYLIEAAVDNGYAWLSVVIVLGSAISLAYYLRVVAAIWMRDQPVGAGSRLTPAGRPIMAGGDPSGDEVGAVAHRRLEQSPVGSDAALMGKGQDHVPASHPLAVVCGVVCAAATIFFGIFPQPLFDVAQDAGRALSSLL